MPRSRSRRRSSSTRSASAPFHSVQRNRTLPAYSRMRGDSSAFSSRVRTSPCFSRCGAVALGHRHVVQIAGEVDEQPPGIGEVPQLVRPGEVQDRPVAWQVVGADLGVPPRVHRCAQSRAVAGQAEDRQRPAPSDLDGLRPAAGQRVRAVGRNQVPGAVRQHQAAALRGRPLEAVQVLDALHGVLAAGLLDPDQELVIVRVEADAQLQRDVSGRIAGECDPLPRGSAHRRTDASIAPARRPGRSGELAHGRCRRRPPAGCLRNSPHSGSPSSADTVSRSASSIETLTPRP